MAVKTAFIIPTSMGRSFQDHDISLSGSRRTGIGC
jgi:hypothetical protein